MKRIFLFLLSLLLFCVPAFAAPIVHARPALWHVKGKGGEAYLLGSIHVLPPGIEWQTPALKRAIKRAAVFVFEVPTDADNMARMRDLILARGYLPDGPGLREKLDPDEQADFDAALAASGLTLGAVDRERPWLATLQITFAELARAHYDPGSGVDVQVMQQAAAAHKAMRYFETIEEQFDLIAPSDESLEMNEFRSDLKDLAKADSEISDLVTAWGHGDTAAIDELMNSALDAYPDAKKALLDDRNQRWLTQIESMLREKQVFFITVGAGHLAGPKGVPALLRAAGYMVDGP